MKKKFGALIIIMSLLTSSLLAGCQAGGASADGVIHLKFGIVNSDTTNYYKGCVAIADEVREATNGKLILRFIQVVSLEMKEICMKVHSLAQLICFMQLMR